MPLTVNPNVFAHALPVADPLTQALTDLSSVTADADSLKVALGAAGQGALAGQVDEITAAVASAESSIATAQANEAAAAAQIVSLKAQLAAAQTQASGAVQGGTSTAIVPAGTAPVGFVSTKAAAAAGVGGAVVGFIAGHMLGHSSGKKVSSK